MLTHLYPMHPFSAPWKHQKSLWFSDVFRRWRKGALGTSELIINSSTNTILLNIIRSEIWRQSLTLNASWSQTHNIQQPLAMSLVIRIWNPVKHLKWSSWRKKIFCTKFILDSWKGSEYASWNFFIFLAWDLLFCQEGKSFTSITKF